MAGHIATAARTDWCTPERVLEVVRAFFKDQIDLDPCSNAKSTVKARRECRGRGRKGGDGLALVWSGHVYANPPFGKGIDRWVSRAAWYACEVPTAEVIMLLPAAVDTRWWQMTIRMTASAVCFWRGRIRFAGAKAAAPMPCAFVYWGPRARRFHSHFSGYGWVVRP
jgi:hypothetical protein